MKLGMEVCLDTCQIVLDGDPAPPKIGAQQPPVLGPCIVAKRNMMPLGTVVGFGSGHIVLDGDPTPPQKGTTAPNIRLMSVVAKRLDGSCDLV